MLEVFYVRLQNYIMQYNFDLSIVSLHASNKLQKQNDLY